MQSPPRRFHPLTTLAALLLLVAGVGLGYWLIQRERLEDAAAPPAARPSVSSTTGAPQGTQAISTQPEPALGAAPALRPPPDPQRVPPEFPAQVPAAAKTAVEEQSPLAASLANPQLEPREEVRAVMEVLDQYLGFFKGYPAGGNAEITRALAGNNPQGLTLIPPEHQAINAAGELQDRWSTPYFFHMISRDQLEVRSAGPDRELYTPDDILIQSPSLRRSQAPNGNSAADAVPL